MKNLLNEITKRTSNDEYPYNVITAEMRLRRLLQNQTLACVASSTEVSTSYVSRVEQNQIRPNRMFLTEAFKTLNISDDAFSKLEDLEAVLDIAIVGLINNDSSKIKEAIEGYNFENYRFRIINFIVAIIDRDFFEAAQIIKTLDKAVSCMSDIDLYSYTIAASLYEFMIGDYNISKKLLSKMELVSYRKIEYQVIVNLYLFYIAYFLNDASGYRLYKKAFDTIVSSKYIYILDNLNYVYGIYLINNNDLDEFDRCNDMIKNESLKNNLLLYKKIINKNPMNEEDILNSCDFIKIYYYKDQDKAKALDIIDEHKFDIKEFDYNDLVARYLLLDDINEKYEYILKIVSKSDDFKNMKFVRNYFIKEFGILSRITGRYKNFNDLVLEAFNL